MACAPSAVSTNPFIIDSSPDKYKHVQTYLVSWLFQPVSAWPSTDSNCQSLTLCRQRSTVTFSVQGKVEGPTSKASVMRILNGVSSPWRSVPCETKNHGIGKDPYWKSTVSFVQGESFEDFATRYFQFWEVTARIKTWVTFLNTRNCLSRKRLRSLWRSSSRSTQFLIPNFKRLNTYQWQSTTEGLFICGPRLGTRWDDGW